MVSSKVLDSLIGSPLQDEPGEQGCDQQYRCAGVKGCCSTEIYSLGQGFQDTNRTAILHFNAITRQGHTGLGGVRSIIVFDFALGAVARDNAVFNYKRGDFIEYKNGMKGREKTCTFLISDTPNTQTYSKDSPCTP